jgi:hypothetical protein
MAVTVEYTGNPMFPWQVSSLCKTKAEAFAKAARVEDVNAEAFIALPVPTDSPKPHEPPNEDDLPPNAVADADDSTAHLKAGEAV